MWIKGCHPSLDDGNESMHGWPWLVTAKLAVDMLETSIASLTSTSFVPHHPSNLICFIILSISFITLSYLESESVHPSVLSVTQLLCMLSRSLMIRVCITDNIYMSTTNMPIAYHSTVGHWVHCVTRPDNIYISTTYMTIIWQWVIGCVVPSAPLITLYHLRHPNANSDSKTTINPLNRPQQ